MPGNWVQNLINSYKYEKDGFYLCYLFDDNSNKNLFANYSFNLCRLELGNKCGRCDWDWFRDKDFYASGFILTSNKKANYITLFDRKTLIPRLGLMIGYEFKTKNK